MLVWGVNIPSLRHSIISPLIVLLRMNSKITWFWALLAAGLFAFIFFFEGRLHKPDSGPGRILPASPLPP